MKIKEGYILDKIGDQPMAISTGYDADQFSGMVKLNGAGAYLWSMLEEEKEEEELVKALVEKYGIDAETAKRDLKNFLALLEEKGILE